MPRCAEHRVAGSPAHRQVREALSTRDSPRGGRLACRLAERTPTRRRATDWPSLLVESLAHCPPFRRSRATERIACAFSAVSGSISGSIICGERMRRMGFAGQAVAFLCLVQGGAEGPVYLQQRRRLRSILTDPGIRVVVGDVPSVGVRLTTTAGRSSTRATPALAEWAGVRSSTSCRRPAAAAGRRASPPDRRRGGPLGDRGGRAPADADALLARQRPERVPAPGRRALPGANCWPPTRALSSTWTESARNTPMPAFALLDSLPNAVGRAHGRASC